MTAQPSALTIHSEAMPRRVRSPLMQVVLRILRNPPATLGVLVIGLMLVMAVFAPALAPYPYDQQNLNAVEQPPSAAHWFGTDALGRDMFSRVIWGARSAVFVIVMVTLLDLTLGIPLGALAGYLGGWADACIMRLGDILLAFPGLLFAFLIAATIKPPFLAWAKSAGLGELARSGYLDYAVVIVAFGAIGWTGLARLVRAQVMSIKEREFVIGAQAVGVPGLQIVFRHILPNAIAPVIVVISMGMGGIAMSESYLSFLGIGLQPPTPSWGNILADNAGRYWRTFPQMLWLVFIPGLVLAAVVFAFNFFGDGLNEALNPEVVD